MISSFIMSSHSSLTQSVTDVALDLHPMPHTASEKLLLNFVRIHHCLGVTEVKLCFKRVVLSCLPDNKDWCSNTQYFRNDLLCFLNYCH